MDAAKSVSEMHSPESDYSTAYTVYHNKITCMEHGSYLTLKPLYDFSMFILVVFFLFPIWTTLQTRSKLLYVQVWRRMTLQDNKAIYQKVSSQPIFIHSVRFKNTVAN